MSSGRRGLLVDKLKTHRVVRTTEGLSTQWPVPPTDRPLHLPAASGLCRGHRSLPRATTMAFITFPKHTLNLFPLKNPVLC